MGRPGLPIKGFDPVAYFDQGGPRVSLAKYTWQRAANLEQKSHDAYVNKTNVRWLKLIRSR